MKPRHILAVGIPALVLAAGLLGPRAWSRQPEGAEDDALKLIAGYKEWKKANETPEKMHSRLVFFCIAPTEKQVKLEQQNPHNEKFITVFVNQAGQAEFMGKLHPAFPEGTVIVKEKLPSLETNASAELLTVMVKRKA